MGDVEGLIFDIKKYAIHDGPGIRTTVFLKGCPLSCPWCHNPEGIRKNPELMWYDIDCVGCGDCVSACPNDALKLTDEGIVIDRDACEACGTCVEACDVGALELIGKAWTPDALLEAIRPVAEALGIPATRRKAKLTQAIRFATIVAEGLGQGSGTVRLLDLACGRSYVGFVLAAILKAQGREIRLHGVDANEALIGTSQRIAEELGWDWATFEAADLASYHVERGSYDVAVALHACDTLTDEALPIAHE